VKSWQFDRGIRPNVVTADGNTLYTQLSYLNGVVKYDLAGRKELQRSEQPAGRVRDDDVRKLRRVPARLGPPWARALGGRAKLCDCGTIDNTVSIVILGRVPKSVIDDL
jgi:hypothetical protein